MRSRTTFTTFVSLAVVVLAFAGCGSTKATTTTAATATTTAATSSSLRPSQRPVKSATYSVNLSGAQGVSGALTPAGAPNGSGLAVISIDASSGELCWTFSRLKNVTAPTVARIYRSVGLGSWRYGFPLGRTYKSSGCVPKPLPLLGLLEADPQEWYVSIHSARFPGGAVRGQV